MKEKPLELLVGPEEKKYLEQVQKDSGFEPLSTMQKVALCYYFDHYQLGKKLADITLEEFRQLEKRILEERFFASRNDENIC